MRKESDLKGSAKPSAGTMAGSKSWSRTVWGGNAANDTVDFIVEVIENDCSGLVFWLEAFPGIAHEPIARLLSGESANVDSVVWGTSEST
jgi:hypothetical protein